MKKHFITLSLLILSVTFAFGQTYNGDAYRKKVKPTKNVIVMIPDGTSIGVVSAARWYKIYNNMGNALNIDPYICGTVKTFSSNAPIGDSAPTTSAYMTGMPQQTGNVAIYPVADPDNDLVAVDPSMAYQPLATALEAARIEKKKSTGLVVTVEFPHATPADCSSHYYNRGSYDRIAPQMAYQNLDVMFGGGTTLVSDDMKEHFKNEGISYYANDINGFRNHKDGKAWALFKDKDMSYDINRDPAEEPSLAEMTKKAIDLLSKDKDGFFLMVEGSKIDWLAHANDAVGCITEYIAFDNAVKEVIDFAKKDGNTTVIILPDHGNSGFTLGSYSLNGYDKASIDKLFGAVSKYKRTAAGMEEILLKQKPEDFKAVMKEYTGIDLKDDELEKLLSSKNYKAENYMKVADGPNMTSTLCKIMNSRTYFGFTTGGHTGEEVFLAAYHPKGDIPVGMNTNVDINHYLSDVLGLKTRLPELTKQIFAKHTDVFAGCELEVDSTADEKMPTLIVKKNGYTLKVPAYKSIAYLNDQPFSIGSVTVYVDKTETFYLSSELAKKLK